MKSKVEVEKEAIKYLKVNRKFLFETYLDKYFPIEEKVAYFTAGPSGVGKTEFIQQFLEVESNLVHLDIDKVRDFLYLLAMMEATVIYFKNLQVGVFSSYSMKL